MRRLEAPVRNKPGIDQHQRRTLRTDLCDMGSDTRKCSAAGRLCVTERRLNRSAGDRRRERAVAEPGNRRRSSHDDSEIRVLTESSQFIVQEFESHPGF